MYMCGKIHDDRWTKAQTNKNIIIIYGKKYAFYLHTNRTTGIPIDLLTVRLIVAAQRGTRIRIKGKWERGRERESESERDRPEKRDHTHTHTHENMRQANGQAQTKNKWAKRSS